MQCVNRRIHRHVTGLIYRFRGIELLVPITTECQPVNDSFVDSGNLVPCWIWVLWLREYTRFLHGRDWLIDRSIAFMLQVWQVSSWAADMSCRDLEQSVRRPTKDWTTMDRFLAEKFSLRHHIHKDSEVHQATCPLGSGGLISLWGYSLHASRWQVNRTTL